MPKKIKKARYPQRCKVCGHSWLAFTWKGPKQCPNDLCGSAGWQVGPRYLTANRKRQGWRKTPAKRKTREEWELEGLLIYEGHRARPIKVVPLGEIVEGTSSGVAGVAEDAPGSAQNALGGAPGGKVDSGGL